MDALRGCISRNSATTLSLPWRPAFASNVQSAGTSSAASTFAFTCIVLIVVGTFGSGLTVRLVQLESSDSVSELLR